MGTALTLSAVFAAGQSSTKLARLWVQGLQRPTFYAPSFYSPGSCEYIGLFNGPTLQCPDIPVVTQDGSLISIESTDPWPNSHILD